MKFLDQVLTPRGLGLVIGRMTGGKYDGQILISIARKDLTGEKCKGPCANLIFKVEDIEFPIHPAHNEGASDER